MISLENIECSLYMLVKGLIMLSTYSFQDILIVVCYEVESQFFTAPTISVLKILDCF